jgi:hypothetical protein
MHEVAGFEYDSSFFFHDHMAFRNSAALPFYVWNQKLQRPLQVLQLPVFCMDGSLFQYQSLNSDEAFQSLLSRTKMIKLVEGLGVLDWHEDTSHPLHPRYSEWGKCYFRYLEALSADGDVWVTSLKDITNWLDQRRRILTS